MGIFSKLKKQKPAATAEVKEAGKVEVAEKKLKAKPKAETKAKNPQSKPAVAKNASSEKKPAGQFSYGHQVLLRPLVTEKSAHLHEMNKYVFQVAMGANKVMVEKAVKEVFGVSPSSVRIITVGGKKVRYGRRQGQRSDRKKAIVTLPKGQSIKIYEGV